MTTTTAFTPQQKLALIKHLAGGKSADVVAAIMHTTKDQVVELARSHGYPDTKKLAWAADILEKKIADGEHLEERRMAAGTPTPTGPIATVTRPQQVTQPTTTLTRPDELRVLLNTAKSHPCKRIQAAADRIFDQVSKLRQLIVEDEEKNAEKRRVAAEKAAAKAEVERLQRELAAAKARLRPNAAPETTSSTSSTPATSPQASEPAAKDIRAWAKDSDVACPEVGRVPASVRDAYLEAHHQAAAS